jgi:hypothetical protein
MKESTFVPGDLLYVAVRTYIWKTDCHGDSTRWGHLDDRAIVICLPCINGNSLGLCRCLTQFGIVFIAADQLKRD